MKELSEDSKARIKQGAINGALQSKLGKAERRANFFKACLRCGNNIGYDKRRNTYCSHSCAASEGNIGQVRNPRKHPQRECPVCETKLPSRCKTFCSVVCRETVRWFNTKKQIEAQGGWSRFNPVQIKKWLEEQHGWKCSICGLTEWLGNRIPLVMDHVNGNPEDHSCDNLRFVCGNCDMLLPTYKSKNKGNGRASRKARYANGKSY